MLMELWRQFDEALDRYDVGGWLMLVSGFVIIAVTALAPAWRDVSSLEVQRRQLHRQVALLQIQEQNYHAFVRAVDRNDPLLLKRLAWDQLRQRPVGGRLLMRTTMTGPAAPSIDRWVQPAAMPLNTSRADAMLAADSKLMRLISGPSRPWVVAFGGWLLLMGLLLNPQHADDH